MIAKIHRKRWQLLVRKPTFKEHFWAVLVAPNGETVMTSETYTQKHNVTEMLNKYFPMWEQKDLTVEKPYNKHI
jgi:Domain of unknown function (DUF1508)